VDLQKGKRCERWGKENGKISKAEEEEKERKEQILFTSTRAFLSLKFESPFSFLFLFGMTKEVKRLIQ